MPRFLRSGSTKSSASTGSDASIASSYASYQQQVPIVQPYPQAPLQQSGHARFAPAHQQQDDYYDDDSDYYNDDYANDYYDGEDDDRQALVGEKHQRLSDLPPAYPGDLPPPATLSKVSGRRGGRGLLREKPMAMAVQQPMQMGPTGQDGWVQERDGSHSVKVPLAIGRMLRMGQQQWEKIPQEKKDRYMKKALEIGEECGRKLMTAAKNANHK